MCAERDANDIAAVFVATLTLSGSAQEFITDARALLFFRTPIVRLQISLPRSGTTKESGTQRANHANSCVCLVSNPG